MQRIIFITVAILGLSATIVAAQATSGPQESPKEVVEHFWKVQSEGAWLGPEQWDKLRDFLTETGPWYPPGAVSVLSSYSVGETRKDVGSYGISYSVEVDQYRWGSIDRYLNFTRAHGPGRESPIAGQPIELRTSETLYLSDHFVEHSESGDKVETGAPQLRIVPGPLTNVDVDAAIRWVAAMRDKSDDPAIRYNAERTLATLRALSAGAPLSTPPARVAKESPSTVARQFIAIESVSLPDQWGRVANFFVETPKPEWNKVHIVDIVDTGVDASGDSAEVDISTNSLGNLDASLRLSSYPPERLLPGGASACIGDDVFGFNLVLSDKRWDISEDNVVEESDVPFSWRVEDTSFEPLISLGTAIRYVRQVRDESSDPMVKKNAAKTLRILNYYQQHRPLPDELLPADGGGS